MLVLEGLPKGTELVASDDSGKVLGRGAAKGGRANVSFAALLGTQLYVDAEAGEGAKKSSVRARLVRGHVEQRLR